MEGIITHGGEPNVIETVKRNGTALPVTGKAVDVAVPEKVSELTNDSGYQTAEEVSAALAGKADANHGHPIGAIEQLQDNLDQRLLRQFLANEEIDAIMST